MKKHHVALFFAQSLLGEGLQHLLGKLVDVNILGPWVIDDEAIHHLNLHQPDIVVIAIDSITDNDPCSRSAALLTTQILEKHTGLPVIQVFLAHNHVHIYNSHIIPARGTDLIEAIRNLGTQAKNP